MRGKIDISLDALEDIVALGHDAGTTVDDLVGQTAFLDVLFNAFVGRTGLEPKRRNAEGLGLFEQATGNLQRECVRYSTSSEEVGNAYLRAGDNAHGGVRGIGELRKSADGGETLDLVLLL